MDLEASREIFKLEVLIAAAGVVLLAVFSGWIIYLDKSGRKGWNGRFGEETLSGDAAVFENRTKNDELENIKNTENKKGKRKNKPGLYKDPVDLKATYPVIEADGGIDFYPEHFMTCIGTWGFGSYSYMEEDAVNYMNGLNDLAQRMEGRAVVYNMPIPLSSSIKIPDAHWQALSSIRQGEAIDRILGLGSQKVMQVQIYNTLMAHREEYVYFRTDHHWTARGAYYAYRHFCKRKGISPHSLKEYSRETAKGYIGYYGLMTQDADLLAHPDSVTIYHPLSRATITTTKKAKDGGGTWQDDLVVQKTADYAGAFIHGDNAFSDIVNIDLKDGESCVVIKDSFGNAFIPFLVDHYKHVYVADFRYCEKTIPQIVEEYGVDDIIFSINITNLRNSSVVGQIVQMTR